MSVKIAIRAFLKDGPQKLGRVEMTIDDGDGLETTYHVTPLDALRIALKLTQEAKIAEELDNAVNEN